MICLFKERNLLIKALNNKYKNDRDFINNLYKYHPPSSSQEADLYNLIIKPIETELNGVNTIYISPAGFLHPEFLLLQLLLQ